MTPRPGRYDDGDTIRAELYRLRNDLPQFVVYDHPADAPDLYIARLWVSLPEPTPCALAVGFRDLDKLRLYMVQLGLTQLDRLDADDPKIVETWI